MGETNWGEALAAQLIQHHDVEWYADHDAQRNAVKHWCVANSRNAQQSSSNCTNAFLTDTRVAGRALGWPLMSFLGGFGDAEDLLGH